jgi:hypothetical protein
MMMREKKYYMRIMNLQNTKLKFRLLSGHLSYITKPIQLKLTT